MEKKIKLNFSNISELLIISLPVCLLFSNIISEIVVFALILICFKSFDKNILKKKFNNLIFYLFLILSIYFIKNYFVNFSKNPDFLRSFFFIRFPLFAFSLYLILDILDLNLNKIIKSWTIILIVIIIDLFFQYSFGKNLLGYPSIPQDYMQRLGGFLNDELKIANLIIYFFVPIFTYFHQNFFESRNKKILILILIIAVYIAIFLTERDQIF